MRESHNGAIRTSLRARAALATLATMACVLALTGLAAPAWAAATGSIAGRFTTADGSGIGGAQVTVSLGDVFLSTDTDQSGAYRLDNVPAADGYIVWFNNWAAKRSQYAYGKTTEAEADKITVVEGMTTTVDDSLLAGGDLRIRALDNTSGAPAANFCVYLTGPVDQSGCTTGSELVLTGINPGTYHGSLTPRGGSLYLPADLTATVDSGAATTIAVPMAQGGAITAVVTDAATGQPIAGACLAARTLAAGALGEHRGNCTNAQGSVLVGPIAPGTYTLFARASVGSSYGHQWVGAAGGTGNQPDAAKITVTAGEVAAGPAVRLDHAGTITGVVTVAATGVPTVDGYLAYSAWHFAVGRTHGVAIAEDGRYTLTGLGPYDWPLYIVADGVAPQWSGGASNRFEATKISVRAGQTTTYSPALVTGDLLSGTATPATGNLDYGRLMGFNALTNEPIGVAGIDADGTYQMRIIGDQAIKLFYEWATPDGEYHEGWYDGASGPADADEVVVPGDGGKALDLTMR